MSLKLLYTENEAVVHRGIEVFVALNYNKVTNVTHALLVVGNNLEKCRTGNINCIQRKSNS